jgi:uncharacterized protein
MKELVRTLSQAAKNGDSRACYFLALCFSDGLGVQANQRKAIEWYRKAAEAGDPEVEFELAYLFDHGIGVRKDPKNAFLWYERAALHGIVEAQFNLGIYYEHGTGRRRDVKKAIHWFLQAAKQGDVDAQFRIGYLFEQTKKTDLAEAWYLKAAKNGNVDAQFNLGLLYQRKGRGSWRKALHWHKQAAKQNLGPSATNVGVMHSDGKFLKPNHATAAKWFEMGARLGDEKGWFNLGQSYEFGEGVPINAPRALECYIMAARNGSKSAKRSLSQKGFLKKALHVPS